MLHFTFQNMRAFYGPFPRGLGLKVTVDQAPKSQTRCTAVEIRICVCARGLAPGWSQAGG